MGTLAEYCKTLEQAETDRRGVVGQPIYIRIDGAGFSRFTKGMTRPYDERLSRSMIETTKALMAAYPALVGCTQSDEISLVFYDPKFETHHGGKFQKIVSRLASKATASFTIAALNRGLSDFVERMPPEFDARAFAVPSLADAAKLLRWREIDATKNAVSMAARCHFSHKQIQGKTLDDMLAMLAARGVDFDAFPSFFKKGTYVQRITEWRNLEPDELAQIPERHRPDGPVQRHRLVELQEFELSSAAGASRLPVDD